MDVRAAEPDDAERIERIAEQSFQTSYSLSPDQIETIVAAVFSEDALRERIEDEANRIRVAEEGGEVLGFADVEVGDHAILRWLHVEPGHRGQGAGTALIEDARDLAAAGDGALVGTVLAEDDEGEQFCEQFGYERGEKVEIEFAEESYHAYVYSHSDPVAPLGGDEPVDVPDTVTMDGRELTVDADDDVPGTDGPFFRTFEDPADEEAYGYVCSNCGSVEIGSDSLGRLECKECGNKHLADQWDAAYL
ncbi:GNAT family N-acetyltransferase [Halomicrobium salinisoli]|uniref:GNAT family N-acetyltransferase n=1 Tax=Halomicrobium salinisoli TaxID=2878391 RepID=UPI001CF0731D|nr:GNAT family N-acetyltransferase [Halomicrobium salinisoli]